MDLHQPRNLINVRLQSPRSPLSKSPRLHSHPETFPPHHLYPTGISPRALLHRSRRLQRISGRTPHNLLGKYTLQDRDHLRSFHGLRMASLRNHRSHASYLSGDCVSQGAGFTVQAKYDSSLSLLTIFFFTSFETRGFGNFGYKGAESNDPGAGFEVWYVEQGYRWCRDN